jgi:VCBS repeat-containing protein
MCSISYTITATDDNGTPASDTQTVVITITGTNDTPNITVDSGNSASSSLIETNTTLTSSGTLNVVDLDRTDVITTSHVVSSVQKDASGNVMNTDSNEPINSLLKDMLSITHTPIDGTTQTGVINWTFNSGSEAFNYLATGETLTLTYTITATDDNGTPASDTQTVVITITGTNDTPTVSLENIDDKTPFGKEFTKETAYLFSDLDTTDVFNFEAVNLPRGLIIDSRTGIISGAPVESGIFEVTLKITDSGTPTLGVTRTFSLLVIAPPQPEVAKTITPPSVVEPLSTNNEIKLSNYSSTNNNLGVLNFGTNNGVGIDPGNGYLDTGSKNAPVDAQATVSKANSTSEQASQSNSQSSSSSVNNDAKGIIQANVDLNVTNDGQVKFNDNNNNLAMSSVGITIEDIKINNNLIELKIADTNPGQNYVVSQANGEALPVGIIFDPRTGSIKGTIPENLNELSLSIKAVNADGTTRVLNLKIDLKQFKQKPQAELNEKYIGLKEQLAFENEKLEGYGTYLTKLFA